MGGEPADRGYFPDLDRWAAGNSGLRYVWTFAAAHPGPHVLLQAITHGNEVCGAIALDWLLDSGFRPLRGTLSICFANVAAYRTFDSADPVTSRCVDEDYNRLWDNAVLDGPRTSATWRGRASCVAYDRADYCSTSIR
jgi:predicted deacylase